MTLEKVSMEVDFRNCGEIVSLSDIEFVAQTHARAPYSSPRLMIVDWSHILHIYYHITMFII